MPVTGFNMHFDVSGPEGISNFYFGMQKVGAGIGIVFTKVNNLQRLPLCTGQGLRFDPAVAPNELNEFFLQNDMVLRVLTQEQFVLLKYYCQGHFCQLSYNQTYEYEFVDSKGLDYH